MSTSSSSPEVANRRSKSSRAQSRLAWILLTPTVIVLTIVIIIPVLQSLEQSLYGKAGLDENTGFVSKVAPFVGLKNYTDIFTSAGERFWTAAWNTTLFGVVTVVLETVLGVAMALIMHKAMRGRGFVRAAILVPWAIPTAVSAILWGWIFNQDGVANAVLGQHIMWASGGTSAKMAIIIADVWKTAPYIGLLTLAGLQVIPDEVYEAAKIDGANAWRRFTSITLPLVKPALAVAVLFRALDALRMFDLPYILIGPRKASVETISMLVQDEASNLRYGSAAAYALILFLYVFIFAFVKITGTDLGASVEKRKKKGGKLPASAFLPKRRPAATDSSDSSDSSQSDQSTQSSDVRSQA